MMQSAKGNKNTVVWITAVIAASLFLFNWIFGMRIDALKNKAAQNKEQLDAIVPDFGESSLAGIKREIEKYKGDLASLSALFDPKDKWLKKDYDLSIYFAEELGNTTQALKAQASRKQVSFVDLGFKEKLPQEKEATYLLSYLFGLREIISTGMDYGIDFKSVTHIEPEKESAVTGIQTLRTRIEFSCPAQSLLEFIISLNSLIPRVSLESLSLKSQDTFYEVVIEVDNFALTLDFGQTATAQDLEAAKEKILQPSQDFISLIRGNNPFFVPAPPEPEKTIESPEVAPPAKPLVRFIYKGNAVLKSQTVAVLEDALEQETLFLKRGESIGGHVLIDFNADYAVLRSGEGEELTINREE